MTNPNPTSIPQIIRETRGKRALRTFGAELGVSHATVDQWERGIASPNDETLSGWFTSRTDWIARLAIEIYTVRYRNTLRALVDVCQETA